MSLSAAVDAGADTFDLKLEITDTHMIQEEADGDKPECQVIVRVQDGTGTKKESQTSKETEVPECNHPHEGTYWNYGDLETSDNRFPRLFWWVYDDDKNNEDEVLTQGWTYFPDDRSERPIEIYSRSEWFCITFAIHLEFDRSGRSWDPVCTASRVLPVAGIGEQAEISLTVDAVPGLEAMTVIEDLPAGYQYESHTYVGPDSPGFTLVVHEGSEGDGENELFGARLEWHFEAPSAGLHTFNYTVMTPDNLEELHTPIGCEIQQRDDDQTPVAITSVPSFPTEEFVIGGVLIDCDGNGQDDHDEIFGNPILDCNLNSRLDVCELAAGSSADCQPNGVLDECDIRAGTDTDLNFNGIPDSCELTGMDEPTAQRSELGIRVWPNPLNPGAQIEFVLPAPGHVLVELFNVEGRRLATLLDEGRSSGRHRIYWDGRDDKKQVVANGVYLVSCRSGGFQQNAKLVVLK